MGWRKAPDSTGSSKKPVMVPEYLGAAAPGVGAMTMEEASIQAMPPIVIRRGCFMISPFILRQSEWLFSDGSLASAMPKSAARHGEVQGAAGRNEERVVRSGVLLLTTSATGSWQEPGDVGLEGERTGGVRVSPNVTGDAAKGPRAALVLAVRSHPCRRILGQGELRHIRSRRHESCSRTLRGLQRRRHGGCRRERSRRCGRRYCRGPRVRDPTRVTGLSHPGIAASVQLGALLALL